MNAELINIRPDWEEHCEQSLRSCRRRLELVVNSQLIRDRLRFESAYKRLNSAARSRFDAIRLTLHSRG